MTEHAYPDVVLATRNAKKCAELRALLAPYAILVRSLSEYGDVPEVIEDGVTFSENAAKKASQTARLLGCWTIGEDSGLEVDVLQGAPGVYSARYSGTGATDASNTALLLARMTATPDERRGARYVCHVALADPTGRVRLHVEAACRGRITRELRGTQGFGYDPCFLIPELHRTFGELSPLVKQQLSHRGRALHQLIPQLLLLLQTRTSGN
jgi:XTP/dITP diphosphohydrolase